jgi:hypothetical protein
MKKMTQISKKLSLTSSKLNLPIETIIDDSLSSLGDAKDFIKQTRAAAARNNEERMKRSRYIAPSPSALPPKKMSPSPHTPLTINRLVPKKKPQKIAPKPSPSPSPIVPPKPKPAPPASSPLSPPPAAPPSALHEDLTLASWSPSTELCGTVKVIPGSTLVTTSCDLRNDIMNGDGIRIGTFESTVTTPRDQRTLTLNDPFQGIGGSHLKPYKIDLVAQYLEGFTPLPGCFSMLKNSNVVSTSMDVRRFIGVGEVIRLRNQDFTLIAPRTESTIIVSKPFQLRSSGSGCERGYKRIRPWDGGLTPLTCCVSTYENSNIIQTDHDLTNEIKTGDTIRIRTETFIISSIASSQFQVNPVSRLSSSHGLRAFLQLNCTRLPGTVGVTKGDSLVTTTNDLRSLLNTGDTVEMGSEQYEVVSSPDRMSIVISRDWIESTMNRIQIKKCLFPTDDGDNDGNSNMDTSNSSQSPIIPLSTSLRLTHKSLDGVAVINPDIDDLGIGDRIRLCGIPYTIKSIEQPPNNINGGGSVFQLNRPYDGTTGTCRIWRMPLSHKQRILNALAARKLRCLSLYCLAKIEEEERSASFDLDSEMVRLPSSSWTTLEGKDTMDSLQAEVDKENSMIAPSPSKFTTTSPSPLYDELSVESDEKILKKPGAGPSLPVGPVRKDELSVESDEKILKKPGAGPSLPVGPVRAGEKGTQRISSRGSDDKLQKIHTSEEDAMTSDQINLAGLPSVVGYKEKENNDYPDEEGNNRGAKKDIIQTVNLPEKRRHQDILDNSDLTKKTLAEINLKSHDLLADWGNVVKEENETPIVPKGSE